MRAKLLYTGLVILVIIPVLFFPSIANTSPSTRNQLTMLLIPLRSPSTMFRDFLPLKRYIEERLNMKITIKVARKSSDVIKKLKNGDADVAYLCPTLYCDAFRSAGIEPLVKIRVNGTSYYRSVLLVRRDSAIKKTSDLIGKTFVYGRYACPGSGLLPQIVFKRIGMSDDDLFDVVKLGSDESALTAVMARMFDATAVPEMAARPYLKKGLRVIRYSNPIPQYLFVASSSLGDGLMKKLRDIMLSINNLEDPAAVVGGIEKGTDGFDIARNSDYGIVRVLMDIAGENSGEEIATGENVIRVVVEPVYFRPDLFVTLNPLIEYLSKRTKRNFQLVIPENADTFTRLVKKGKADFFYGNGDIASLNRSLNLVANTTGLTGITGRRRGIIITRSDSKIKSIKKLAGGKIGITSFYAVDGYPLQLENLKIAGVSPGSVDYVKFSTYEKVIMNLYRGEVDAGFVNDEVLNTLREDIDLKRIRIISRTPPVKGWGLFSKRGLNDGLVKDILRFIKEYEPEPE